MPSRSLNLWYWSAFFFASFLTLLRVWFTALPRLTGVGNLDGDIAWNISEARGMLRMGEEGNGF